MKNKATYMFIMDNLRNMQYQMMFLLTVGISLVSLYRLLRDGLYIASVANIYLMLNIAIFCFSFSVAQTSIVLAEKISGRCEHCLANGVTLRSLMRHYVNSVYFLSAMPVVVFNLLSIPLFAISDALGVAFHPMYLLFLAISFGAYICITKLIAHVILITKKPERIRLILTLVPMALIFGVSLSSSLSSSLLSNDSLSRQESGIYLVYSATLLIVAAIAIVLNIILRRFLTSEAIILSYRQ